jgi:hypothetical protein
MMAQLHRIAERCDAALPDRNRSSGSGRRAELLPGLSDEEAADALRTAVALFSA